MADYKNMFSLIGKSDAEVKQRLLGLFDTIFFDEEERFYPFFPQRRGRQ